MFRKYTVVISPLLTCESAENSVEFTHQERYANQIERFRLIDATVIVCNVQIKCIRQTPESDIPGIAYT